MADPLVSLANRDATEAKESIHTHYDEDITIVDNSPSLVGRTDEARSDVSHRADRRNRAAAFVPRMIYGLDPSNSAGDLTADIAIAAGIAIDSTNTPTLVLPKSLIKRIEVRGAYRAPLRYWPVPQASGYLSGAVCTRRLSSTTFAPTCNVMFAPGYRSQAAR